MHRSAAALLLGFALALTGCGKQQASAPPPINAPPVPTAQQPAAENKPAAAEVAASPSKITRLNEDGSETVEEVTGDTGSHNPLLAAIASTVAAASAATPAVPGQWQPGTNYTAVVPPQPTSVPAGQVEVLEFFWYACPHCYALDPQVQAWLKSKPAYVTFVRVPTTWNPGHRALARMFYTLQAMGKLDDLHSDIFKEIHVNGDQLIGTDPINAGNAEQVQIAFLKGHGVSEESFKNAYHSLPVDTAIQRADELAQRYHVAGVPTFVINGKYVADVGSAGGPEKLISLVSDLAASEHKR